MAQKEKDASELIRVRMKGFISDEDFLTQKESLENDRQHIKQVLADFGGSQSMSIEEAKQAFNLVVNLADVFRNGTFEEKQEALSRLGSNLTLKSKKIKVNNKEVFSVISKGLLEARAQNQTFEPRKYEADKDETEAFASVRPALLRMLNDIRT